MPSDISEAPVSGATLRICFVCSEYPPARHGGIGTFTQVLGRALVQAGHIVRVVGVGRSGSAPAYEHDDGVEVWRIPEPSHSGGWLLARYRLYRTVADWSRDGAIDLIEVPDYEGWAAAWPTLPVPVVTRLHGSSLFLAAQLQRPLRRMGSWLERRSLRRADAWCAVSRYAASEGQRLFGLRPPPGAVLYNPVDVADPPAPTATPAPSVERRDPTAVFAGTLQASKGVVSLIDAWPAVKAVCDTATLHLYGRDTDAEPGVSMRNLLQRRLPAATQASVVFHGHVPRAQLLGAYHQARVAVFPSFAESFANAPLEAMAAGCPTVYTERCSGPELITNGIDGFLIDPAQPQAIATALVRLLSDNALARRVGAAGRNRVSAQCATSRVTPQNVAFYERCVAEFRHRGGARIR